VVAVAVLKEAVATQVGVVTERELLGLDSGREVNKHTHRNRTLRYLYGALRRLAAVAMAAVAMAAVAVARAAWAVQVASVGRAGA